MTDIQYRSITSLFELEPGDHIQVPPSKKDKKGLGGSKSVCTHHLMVVRVADTKTIEVIHNTKEGGVCKEHKIYRPEDITVVKYWSYFTGDLAVKRAKARVGKMEYSLLTNNCEHFVFEVRNGYTESKQVQAAAAGGVVGGGAGAVTAGGAGAGIGAAVGGVIGIIVPFGGPVAGAILGSFIGGGIGVVVGGGGGATGGSIFRLKRMNEKRK